MSPSGQRYGQAVNYICQTKSHRLTHSDTDMTKTRFPQILFMSYKTISIRDNVQSELLTPREIHAQSSEHIPSTKLTKYKNKVFVKHYAPGCNKVRKKAISAQRNGHDQGHEVGWLY